jgi:hypothetical protein
MHNQFNRRAAILHNTGALPIGSGRATFVLICGGGFNQSVPNAATTMRLGWCRGFELLGIPYVLVAAQDIRHVLPTLPNPLCWVSGSDYRYFEDRDKSFLRQYKHAVLASTAFGDEEQYFSSRGYPNLSCDANLRAQILATNPQFLFTLSSAEQFQYYQWWLSAGAHLVSLPLACDTVLYKHPRTDVDFSQVEVAFVGGYWPYKARQFEKYLRPVAPRLTVYGYTKWPYGKYGGLLPSDHEGALYSQALVSPVINEPHVLEMNVDINERVFKVLASGGLGICDVTKGYREWFAKDELLVPESEAEYWEMMDRALSYPEEFFAIRSAGRKAVLERHTYLHRAQQFAKEFGLDIALPEVHPEPVTL